MAADVSTVAPILQASVHKNVFELYKQSGGSKMGTVLKSFIHGQNVYSVYVVTNDFIIRQGPCAQQQDRTIRSQCL